MTFGPELHTTWPNLKSIICNLVSYSEYRCQHVWPGCLQAGLGLIIMPYPWRYHFADHPLCHQSVCM